MNKPRQMLDRALGSRLLSHAAVELVTNQVCLRKTGPIQRRHQELDQELGKIKSGMVGETGFADSPALTLQLDCASSPAVASIFGDGF